MNNKITITLIILLILSVIGYILNPTLKTNNKNTEGAVFIDITDKQSIQMNAKEIIDFADIENHLYNRHMVWIQTITNYEYSDIHKFELERKFVLASNPYKRADEIKELASKIDNELSVIYQGDTNKEKSSIYAPIMREANRLSHSKAGFRYIIVSSDLGMNEDIFSVFRYNDFNELQNHPEHVIIKLEKELAPEDLTGINFYFIFQPTSPENANRFKLMVHVMQVIIEKHGGRVFVGTSIIHQ